MINHFLCGVILFFHEAQRGTLLSPQALVFGLRCLASKVDIVDAKTKCPEHQPKQKLSNSPKQKIGL